MSNRQLRKAVLERVNNDLARKATTSITIIACEIVGNKLDAIEAEQDIVRNEQATQDAACASNE